MGVSEKGGRRGENLKCGGGQKISSTLSTDLDVFNRCAQQMDPFFNSLSLDIWKYLGTRSRREKQQQYSNINNNIEVRRTAPVVVSNEDFSFHCCCVRLVSVSLIRQWSHRHRSKTNSSFIQSNLVEGSSSSSSSYLCQCQEIGLV